MYYCSTRPLGQFQTEILAACISYRVTYGRSAFPRSEAIADLLKTISSKTPMQRSGLKPSRIKTVLDILVKKNMLLVDKRGRMKVHWNAYKALKIEEFYAE